MSTTEFSVSAQEKSEKVSMENFKPGTNLTKMKAKVAREVLRREVKDLGQQIKELEKSVFNTALTSEVGAKLKLLRQRATVVGMAIALYHNHVHVRKFKIQNGYALKFKNVESQAKMLFFLSNMPTYFSFLTPRQADNIKKILNWEDYKKTHPLTQVDDEVKVGLSTVSAPSEIQEDELKKLGKW